MNTSLVLFKQNQSVPKVQSQDLQRNRKSHFYPHETQIWWLSTEAVLGSLSDGSTSDSFSATIVQLTLDSFNAIKPVLPVDLSAHFCALMQFLKAFILLIFSEQFELHTQSRLADFLKRFHLSHFILSLCLFHFI